MDTEIAGRIMNIIAEQAMVSREKVTLDSTLDDLGIDSLGLVESVFAIEECFDIQIPFNANEQDGGDFDISNVGAIVMAVEGLVNQKDG